MKSNYLISVIIPCYNDAQYIEQAVQSALNQTYSNIEVIIVDDGSNAETKTVLKRLEPRITQLITQENQGQSTARNVGIKAAKGEFIVTLDSDDFFEPTFCEKAIQIFEEPKVRLVSCYLVRFNDIGMIDVYSYYSDGDIQVISLNNQATGSVMFRKEDGVAIGGYDESMRKGFEDWEFYIRLLKNGGLVRIIKEPLLNYRVRINSTTTRANKVKYELLAYIYFKHQDLYKENFTLFVKHLLSKIEREEKEKIKNTKRLEFRIGKFILRPFRWIKSILW
jgi:glycosyltransferase involved in cell wall biosynthesis